MMTMAVMNGRTSRAVVILRLPQSESSTTARMATCGIHTLASTGVPPGYSGTVCPYTDDATEPAPAPAPARGSIRGGSAHGTQVEAGCPGGDADLHPRSTRRSRLTGRPAEYVKRRG